MAQTPNFGFYVVDTSDLSLDTLEVMDKTDGSDENSNIMKIDSILKDLKTTVAFKIIESAEEPPGLFEGDEWDRLLE